MNDLKKLILQQSISIRQHKGEDVAKIFKSYTNLTESEKNEILTECRVTPIENTLEETKDNKIAELSDICCQRITNGVVIPIDSVNEHFTYSLENGDQNNIDDLYNLAIATGLPQLYHCENGACKLYTVEQITNLYLSVKQLKAIETTYFNQLKELIINEYVKEEDKETVSNIQYGDELTGIYLENYNSLMTQYMSTIMKLQQ